MTGYCDGCGNTQCICAEIDPRDVYVTPPPREVLFTLHRADTCDTTIATLTAENAALTQRVAELEDRLTDADVDRDHYYIEEQRRTRERDAAIAEAQRLRDAVTYRDDKRRMCRVCHWEAPGRDGDAPHGEDCPLRALATTPSAASERRVAEQRAIGFDEWVKVRRKDKNVCDHAGHDDCGPGWVFTAAPGSGA